jgi:hypothetical protein
MPGLNDPSFEMAPFNVDTQSRLSIGWPTSAKKKTEQNTLKRNFQLEGKKPTTSPKVANRKPKQKGDIFKDEEGVDDCSTSMGLARIRPKHHWGVAFDGR